MKISTKVTFGHLLNVTLFLKMIQSHVFMLESFESFFQFYKLLKLAQIYIVIWMQYMEYSCYCHNLLSQSSPYMGSLKFVTLHFVWNYKQFLSWNCDVLGEINTSTLKVHYKCEATLGTSCSFAYIISNSW